MTDKQQLTTSDDESEGDSSTVRELCQDWRVILGGGICLFLTVGFDKTSSIIADEFHYHFEQRLVAPTALIFSIKFWLQFAAGPLVAYLCGVFGYPIVVAIGGVLTCLAFISGAYVPELTWMYFTFSILAGVGFSMVITSTFSLVAVTFTQCRGLALGISAMLASCGGIVFPLIIHYIFQFYHHAGGMLLLAGNVLHILIGAMLYYATALRKSYESPQHGADGKSRVKKTESSRLLEMKKDDAPDEQSPGAPYTTILCIPQYTGFCVYIITFMFTYMSTLVHLEDVSLEKGLSTRDVIYTLQGISIADVFVIPTSGLLLDKMTSVCRRVNLYVVVSLLYAGHLALVTVLNSRGLIIAGWILAGVFGMVGHTQAPIVCSHLVPERHIPVAVGVLRFFQGVGVLLGPYITGLVADTTGTTLSILWVNSSVLAVGAVAYLVMYNVIIK